MLVGETSPLSVVLREGDRIEITLYYGLFLWKPYHFFVTIEQFMDNEKNEKVKSTILISGGKWSVGGFKETYFKRLLNKVQKN